MGVVSPKLLLIDIILLFLCNLVRNQEKVANDEKIDKTHMSIDEKLKICRRSGFQGLAVGFKLGQIGVQGEFEFLTVLNLNSDRSGFKESLNF